MIFIESKPPKAKYRIAFIESDEFIAKPTLLLSRIKPLELKESRGG